MLSLYLCVVSLIPSGLDSLCLSGVFCLFVKDGVFLSHRSRGGFCVCLCFIIHHSPFQNSSYSFSSILFFLGSFYLERAVRFSH